MAKLKINNKTVNMKLIDTHPQDGEFAVGSSN